MAWSAPDHNEMDRKALLDLEDAIDQYKRGFEMPTLRLTDREARYVSYVLDNVEGDKPGVIEGRTLILMGHIGLVLLMEDVEDEASYDRSCGVRTAGARLVDKLRAIYDEIDSRRREPIN